MGSWKKSKTLIAKGREKKEKRKKKGVDLTWHLKRRAELIVNASAFIYIYIYIYIYIDLLPRRPW